MQPSLQGFTLAVGLLTAFLGASGNLFAESVQTCAPDAVMEQTEMVTSTRHKSQDAHDTSALGCTPSGPNCPSRYYFTRTEHYIHTLFWDSSLGLSDLREERMVVDTKNKPTFYMGISRMEDETGLICECTQNAVTGAWSQNPTSCYIGSTNGATITSTCVPDRFLRTGSWTAVYGPDSADYYDYYHLISYSRLYTDTEFKNRLINSITYDLGSWASVSQVSTFSMNEWHSYAEAGAFRFRFKVTGGDSDKWYELTYQEVITEVDGKKRPVTKYLTFKGRCGCLGPHYVPSDAGLAFSAPPSTKAGCAASNTTATIELVGIRQITK
jgi:hypothetical protein